MSELANEHIIIEIPRVENPFELGLGHITRDQMKRALDLKSAIISFEQFERMKEFSENIHKLTTINVEKRDDK